MGSKGGKGELTQVWVSLWRHHAPSVAHASEFLQRQNVPTAWSPHQMIPKDKCHPHQRAHTWYTLSNCSSSIRRKFTMGNAIYASEKKRKSKWVPKINISQKCSCGGVVARIIAGIFVSIVKGRVGSSSYKGGHKWSCISPIRLKSEMFKS